MISMVVSVALVAAGCRPHRPAEASATPPTLADAGVPRCTLEPSQLRPLVVEWSGADRGALEVRLQRGVVPVRYEGCTLKVLPDCSAPGEYGFHPFTRKHDTIRLRTADDLYSEMPIGATRLEVKLERSGDLQIDMILVGEYRAAGRSVTIDDLTGTCDGATHIMTAAQVGAFSFHAGADETAEATGARSLTGRELLNSDGTPSACEASSLTASAPPAECGALLRLELAPLLTARPAPPPRVAVAPHGPHPPEPAATSSPETPATPPSSPQALDSEQAPRTRTFQPDEPGTRPDRGEIALGIFAGFFSLTLLVGLGITAAGGAGIVGANKLLREHAPDDTAGIAEDQRYRDTEFKVLYGGIGTSLASATLCAVLFTLAYRGVPVASRTTRVRVAPSLGRTHVGLDLQLRF